MSSLHTPSDSSEQSAASVLRFRKRPVVIEAFRWDGDDVIGAHAFAGHHVRPLIDGNCTVYTLEGAVIARKGDWIIKGVQGGFYPCKPDIFEETYEPVA